MEFSWHALVASLAGGKSRRAERQGLTFDDLVSIGNEAALRAERSWRSDGGRSLSSWVYYCVGAAMDSAVRRMARYIGEDDRNFDPEDAVADVEVEATVMVREALGYLRAKLPDRDWALLWLRYAEGHTCQDLATRSRCNSAAMRARVSRARRTAVTLLRAFAMVG